MEEMADTEGVTIPVLPSSWAIRFQNLAIFFVSLSSFLVFSVKVREDLYSSGVRGPVTLGMIVDQGLAGSAAASLIASTSAMSGSIPARKEA